MLKFVADENFHGDIVRGLRLRRPELDLVRVQDVGLQEAEDPAILAWAAEQERIVLTHDRATMPDFAFARVAVSEKMPGVLVLPDRLPIAQCIEEILLLDELVNSRELQDQVIYLPI